MEAAVAERADAAAGDPLRVLLFGVTPRIARMELPGLSSMLAVDRREAMVRHVWPADIPARRHAAIGDWLRLPAGDASQDVVIGDGALNCVRYPDELRALLGSLRRVLRTDGTILLRCFTRPVRPEDPGDVMEQMAGGPGFHYFKMRLLRIA